MNLNCKPGDLAVSIGSRNAGRFMRVLFRAPPHTFILPNGNSSAGYPDYACWVVELLDGNMRVKINRREAYVRIGVAADRCIKPVRPPDEDVKDSGELCFADDRPAKIKGNQS